MELLAYTADHHSSKSDIAATPRPVIPPGTIMLDEERYCDRVERRLSTVAYLLYTLGSSENFVCERKKLEFDSLR